MPKSQRRSLLRLLSNAALFAAAKRLPNSDREEAASPFEVEFNAFGGEVGDMRTLTFSPNGTLALSGHWNHTAKLWSAMTGKELRTLGGHTGAILSLDFCRDGERALTGSADGTARLWSLSSGVTLQSFETGSWAAATACGERALVGSSMGAATLFDSATGEALRTFDKEGIQTVAVSPDGSKVLTANRQNQAVLWDAEDGKPLRVLEGHKGWILAAAFSPDGELVATGGHDSKVQIWRVATGGKVRKLGKHMGSISSISFSEDGQLMGTGSHDMTARVWHVSSGKQLHQFDRTGQIAAVTLAMETDGNSTKYKAMVGWLKRQPPKPKRNDREQCERECAAMEEEEQRKNMPIFEL